MSSQSTGAEADLSVVTGADVGDGGVPEGRLLVRFAERVLGDDDGMLGENRRQVLERLGPEALVDAAATVAAFNSVVRIADATGIPLDEFMELESAEMRSELGIDRFAAAKAG